MAAVFSTGAKIDLLTSGFTAQYEDGAVLLMSGAPPASPDDGVLAGSQLIAVIARTPASWVAGSGAGFGIRWDAPDATGVVKVRAGDVLVARAVATGLVRYGWLIRDVAGHDVLTASLTIPRIQGVAAVGGGEFILSTTNFTAIGQQATIDVGSVFF